MELTKYQKTILYELMRGGKIFAFDFPVEYGFDDVDGNSFPFRKDTFKALEENAFIYVCERPSLTCQIYGLTEKGQEALKHLPSWGVPFLPVWKRKIK